jgi:hypothetical protein
MKSLNVIGMEIKSFVDNKIKLVNTAMDNASLIRRNFVSAHVPKNVAGVFEHVEKMSWELMGVAIAVIAVGLLISTVGPSLTGLSANIVNNTISAGIDNFFSKYFATLLSVVAIVIIVGAFLVLRSTTGRGHKGGYN